MTHVKFEIQDAVAWITLNRPNAMNALTPQIIADMKTQLLEYREDDSVRVVVLTGTGKAFCAGADLKGVPDSRDIAYGEDDFYDKSDAVFDILRNFPKPVIAALNGITMAGGLELALTADIVVAAEGIQIGDAHANFGVYPGAGGASTLPRVLPLNVAKYLLFTGKTLPAEELKTLGFVNEIYPDASFLESTKTLANHIAMKSPLGLRRMKEIANASLGRTLENSLNHETLNFRKHLRSADMQEGLAAFAEKRVPKFIGH